jgi:predicted enzyme related to lactoylglutathione lyase
MGIRRIVPNIVSAHPDLCREFYAGFLGLRVAMDMGWIATYVSPDNPTAQISVVRGEAPPAADRSISLSVEVADVDASHREAVARGYPILYPLTDEPWGVRRFHVADPNGVVVNVMCHQPPTAARQTQAEAGAAEGGGSM